MRKKWNPLGNMRKKVDFYREKEAEKEAIAARASDEVAKNKDMMRKQRSVFKKEKRTNSINHNFGFIQLILLVLFDQAVQVTLTIHLQFGLRPNG